jgi:hypothetical protein
VAAAAQVNELYTALFVQENGAPVTSGGSLRVMVETVINKPAAGTLSRWTVRKCLVYRMKKININASLTNGTLEIESPELAIFRPERRDAWAANRNDSMQPATIVFAERVLRSYKASCAMKHGILLFRPTPRQCAAAWRHFQHQMTGTGAEMCALSAYSELVVPAVNNSNEAPTAADAAWLGGSVPGLWDYSLEDAIVRGTGTTCKQMCTARTEFRSHSLSPAVLYLVENGAVQRELEDIPVYENTSPEGINRVCHILAAAKTMRWDHAHATNSVGCIGDLLRVVGLGIKGTVMAGRGSQTSQYANLERETQLGFNSKFGVYCGLSVDYVSRSALDTSLGSLSMRELVHTSGPGPCPERIPPYVFPILFGESSTYLSGPDRHREPDPPALTITSLVDETTNHADWLVYGNAHTTDAEHLFVCAPGVGLEDRATPPYSVYTLLDESITGRAGGATHPSALRFDAALVGLLPEVADYTRTMGTVPRVSARTTVVARYVVDAPMLRNPHGGQCLVKLCVPRALKKYVAAAAPVPLGFMEAASSIFR